ncbi:Plasma membrane iron permease [Fusarium oxysporum f. sp. narcissi]|uniref:Plasma membrane iron permease n=1 Tax=Fusarium oxysporum f. sp. narcissi TaxID=451672 RepID=A0A4Q2V1L5_FUSOX|nr:Plasma membrane iron permease [Fusarium oxysporum f. sp. narcissi]
MGKNIFAVQIFFVVFRECLEAVIIISVLLSFLKQTLGGPDQDQAIYKRLVKQVWAGALSGILICLVIGGAFIGAFYGLGKDIWAKSEDLWEGIFYLIAAIIITIMGLTLLRVSKMQDKWKVKIAQSMVETHSAKPKGWFRKDRLGGWSRRHVMFILPFITTLREGIEAVVFVGGVSLGLPATSIPLPVVCGALAGILIGFLIYRGGNAMSIQIFLIASTSVLYLMAAGMFSKSVWFFQYHQFAQRVGSDVAEAGNGPGSYDIRETVWHVNCCNAETDNGWDVFNAILGWQNTATYGSIISYCVYWLFLVAVIWALMYEERTGSLPLRNQTLAAVEKVPGLKGYVQRKWQQDNQDADEIFCHAQIQTRQIQGNL